MKIALVRGRDLDHSLLAAWSTLRHNNPTLRSPFFSPEYLQLCDGIHTDVEVAIVEDGGRPVAFFPFHRVARRTGVPLGKELSDFHGAIAAADLEWSLSDLLRGSRLDSWSFDHLLISQPQFAPYVTGVAESTFVDLNAGYEAFCNAKRQSGSTLVNRTGRAQRLIDRDTGPTSFQMTRDPALIRTALEWQHINLHRRGTFFLHNESTREAMYRTALTLEGDALNAQCAVLYAGSRLLACHYFLCSGDVAHWWLAAFDPSHPLNSPGIIAMLRALDALAAQGITRVDFGKGSNELKERFRNGAERVAEGAIEARPIVRVVRHAWKKAGAWLWQSPLKTAAKGALRRWRQRGTSVPQ